MCIGKKTGLTVILAWEILAVPIYIFFILILVLFPLFKHLLNSVNNLCRNMRKPMQMKTRAECHVGFLLHQTRHVRKWGEGGQK